MTNALRQAHSALQSVVGPEMEPISVIQRAEEHRAYWRPHKVRVVLLAESHVYTTAQELTARLLASPALPEGIPLGFVRLVYCLGYGENGWLDRPIENPPNAGTWQFWEVFHSCVHTVTSRDEFHPVHVTKTASSARLRTKLHLLERLRDNGIWLVDASIAALYIPQRPKPTPSKIKAALKTSWDVYTERVVREAEAEAILCVGLGVARALRSRLARLGAPWSAVAQPNARMSQVEYLRACATYKGVCTEPQLIRDVSFAG